MSRIGKLPVALPDGVKTSVNGRDIAIEGPKGKLSHTAPFGITVKHDAEMKALVVTRDTESKRNRELHGLTRSLLNNMVVGVTEGYKKILEIHGVGYSAKMEGSTLVMELGLADDRRIPAPEGVAIQVTQASNPATIEVSGSDKQVVGDVAARTRKVMPPEPYLGKGIRYKDEVIRRKAGKAFVGG